MITDRAAILGGELVYETAGDDGTNDPVVMLHGGLLDRRQWGTEFTAVAATHRVIRFDARGHGESSLADGDFAFHADLVALLDHLEVQRVTAVGLSLGARTIIDAALVHPRRFGALLLVSPGYSGIEFTDPFVLAQTAAMLAAAGDGDAEAFVEAFLRAWVDGPNRSPADVDPEVRSRCHDMAINAARRGFDSTGRLHEVGAAERFSELSMPVDVVLGELDSADIVAASERIAAAVPGARVDTIIGAGHAANLEQPDAFGVVLRDFLDRRATHTRAPSGPPR